MSYSLKSISASRRLVILLRLFCTALSLPAYQNSGAEPQLLDRAALQCPNLEGVQKPPFKEGYWGVYMCSNTGFCRGPQGDGCRWTNWATKGKDEFIKFDSPFLSFGPDAGVRCNLLETADGLVGGKRLIGVAWPGATDIDKFVSELTKGKVKDPVEWKSYQCVCEDPTKQQDAPIFLP
ncbi:uncharacterized protein AB675_561 [Cyphellophora attinorum]|uniref:Uncharacterized protein n=1 Tax=Cyphellophora attinorum TaxID=1664694 RepID=A0A0N1HBB5_9EURO|nr:uncharacterized protein AB675_561 [Phialophora attinorum]KPI45813.1 hypothetical protein AB675_561 [Phialophora attinorum]